MTSSKPKTCDLTRLRQSDVAWLIGRPTSWLRERGHEFNRNEDGTYDGREVLRTMAGELGRVEITRDQLDELIQYARDPANCESCNAGEACEFHHH